jgi:hypothetical protein
MNPSYRLNRRLGVPLATYEIGTGTLSTVMKPPDHEVDLPPPRYAGVKNMCAFKVCTGTSLPKKEHKPFKGD